MQTTGLMLTAAARQLGVSTTTLLRWEDIGVVRATRDARNYRRFPRDELARLARALRRPRGLLDLRAERARERKSGRRRR